MLWLRLMVYFFMEANVCCQLQSEKKWAYTIHKANSNTTVGRGVTDKGFIQ